MESTKIKLKQICKEYRNLFRRCDARWQKLLYPYPIDPEAQLAEDVKWRKKYNWFIWSVLGILGVLAEILVFPQIDKMIMVPLLLFAFLLAFCAIMQNSRLKKSPAGRKTTAPIASFADCFTDEAFFAKVNDYIVGDHDKEHPMDSPEGQALLSFILSQGQYLRPGVTFNRISSLLIKEYHPQGILSFETSRALSKAKPRQSDKDRLKYHFG